MTEYPLKEFYHTYRSKSKGESFLTIGKLNKTMKCKLMIFLMEGLLL